MQLMKIEDERVVGSLGVNLQTSEGIFTVYNGRDFHTR